MKIVYKSMGWFNKPWFMKVREDIYNKTDRNKITDNPIRPRPILNIYRNCLHIIEEEYSF